MAEQAVSDAASGRLGDTGKYVRKALAGSVVGFLTGASGLMMRGASLGKVLSQGFGEGFLGSAAAQGLLNEDGEINWALAIGDGMFSAVMAGLVWKHNVTNKTDIIVNDKDIPGYANTTCFETGTLIYTKDGYKKIENIRVDDLIWSEEVETGRKGLRRVNKTSKHDQEQLLYIFVCNSQLIIKTTEEHPFWTKNNKWVKAGELRCIDILKSYNGIEYKIDRLERVVKKTTVYNLEVDTWHTYFVTQLGILVHNKANVHDRPGWINHDVYNEIRNKFGKSGVDKFINAMKKGLVSAQNENGIKMLSGKGVKIGNIYYSYEVKIKGLFGDWRIYGNLDESSGHIIFSCFAKGKH